MVDFDNEGTFPKKIKEWVIDNESYFLSVIPDDKFSEGWQAAHKLDDMHLGDNSFVKKYIHENADEEYCLWHTTRVEDENMFWNNGIVAMDNDIFKSENRIVELLHKIDLQKEMMNAVLEKIRYYWKRDRDTRLNTVHFFFAKDFIKDPQLNEFAINLGGECIRWGLNSVDPKLYRTEPYKRLWILGKPSIIKFKCKLEDISERSQETMIIELVKYFVITELYKLSYEFACTGWKRGSVPPENILAIEEIEHFVEMQEQFDDYKHFYDELKKMTN